MASGRADPQFLRDAAAHPRVIHCMRRNATMSPFLVLVLVLGSSAACADDCAIFRTAAPTALELTAIDPEAALVAAIAQGTPVASRYWFERVRVDLARLRRALPPDRRELVVPTPGNRYYVLLDDDAAARVRAGAWPEWSCLVDALGASSRPNDHGYPEVSLQTMAMFNPYRVKTALEALPGVRYVGVNGYYGLHDVLLVAGCAGRISYFVRLGDGDCQAGCIIQDFYWFASGPGQRLRIVDVAPHALPRPEWAWDLELGVFGQQVECGLPEDSR